MELDLDAIKARAEAVRFGYFEEARSSDIPVLIAEVERLRAILAQTEEDARRYARRYQHDRDIAAYALRGSTDREAALRARIAALEVKP